MQHHKDAPPISHSSSTPFWKLLHILQPLLLAPDPSTPGTRPTTDTMRHRFRQFRMGNIQALHDSLPPPPTRPSSESPSPAPTTVAADSFCRSAQDYADQNNYSSAFHCLRSTLPVASITPEVLENIVKPLYPPRRHSPSIPTPNSNPRRPTTRSQALPAPTAPIKIHRDSVTTALRRLQRGTASGPFADSVDVLKAYALHTKPTSPTTTPKRRTSTKKPTSPPNQPYFSTFVKLLDIIANNKLPPAARTLFRTQYSLALHKSPTDPTKLRPIGIGYAYRRIAGAVLIAQFGSAFTSTLLPTGQFGVGVKGGMQYIIHSTLAELEQYIDIPAPLRALLALDVVNMFNEVSRDAIRAALSQLPELAVLIPYFDLLYAEANDCYIRGHDGVYRTFKQDEGVAQGCPLSSAFSSLVQRQLMLSLNADLLRRQRLANKPQTIPKSYMDDTTPILDYADLLWYLTEFQRRGLPLGIQLNFIKTKILSSVSGSTPTLSPTDRAHLEAALQYLRHHGNTDPELVNGIRVLGFPVGNITFAEQFLGKATTSFHRNTDLLTTRLLDPQTQSTLFRSCAQASLTHLLPADVYYQSDPTVAPTNKQWASPFLDQVHATTLQFIRGLTHQTEDLPLLSELLAFYPASLGGAGYRDHADAAVDHFVISTTRSIQYTTNGIPLPDSSLVQLPITLRRPLMDWATPSPTSRLFQLLHSLAPLVLPASTTTSAAILTTDLRGLSRHNYQTSQDQRMNHYLASAPPGFATAVPSLLTPMTSLPLHSLPRHAPTNRLPASIFRTLLQRKLRLPLLPPRLRDQKCSCGKPLDQFGDHFFSCKSSSKSAISNAIRDTVCIVLRKIAPLAGLCQSEHDVTIEPPQWLPNYPHLRPADVGIELSSTPSHTIPFPVKRIAIDVTIAKTPDFSHDPSDLLAPLVIAQRAHKAHHDAARKKFASRGNNSLITHDINIAGIMLLPFTVDLFGQVGHFFHTFLFPSVTLIPAPDPPPWTDPTDFPHHSAFQAFVSTVHQPSMLLDAADKSWDSRTSGRYGDSHHCTTPNQWATQTIALNVSRQIAQHINKNVSKQQDKRIVQKLKKLRYFGSEFYVPPAVPLVSDTNDSDTCHQESQ